MKIRLFIIDDHQLFRDGLRRIVEETSDIVVCDEARDGISALEKLFISEWDIALLDINMPRMNGIEVLKRVMTRNKQSKVLMLSTFHEEEYALRAIQLGASAYLTKDTQPHLLLAVIRRLAAGGKYIDPQFAEKNFFHAPLENTTLHSLLSARELQVLLLIAEGYALNQIAENLQVSAKSVSTYRSRILEKFKMLNNAQLVRYVAEHNLL